MDSQTESSQVSRGGGRERLIDETGAYSANTGVPSMVAKVHCFPLGNADTLLAELANGDMILIDYANMRTPADKADLRCDLPAELRRLLAKARRNKFNALCITHVDDDHCKGFGKFFWLRHARAYQSNDRTPFDELWVPACVLLETGLTDDARLVRAEAIHRLREGKGVLIFSRPERLKEPASLCRATLRRALPAPSFSCTVRSATARTMGPSSIATVTRS
jgi:hypothetical protein